MAWDGLVKGQVKRNEEMCKNSFGASLGLVVMGAGS